MKKLLFVLVVLSPGVVHAGAVYLSGDVPWVTNLRDLDNDDYVGEFDGNPNKFVLNLERDYSQNIFEIERVIPTVPSRGITEYAVAISSGVNVEDEFPPPTSLDSLFQVQLGFGTGENFVRASELAPELRFDTSDNVSPPIEDVRFFIGDDPILEFINHESDTLTYQGRTCLGGACVGQFFWNDRFRMPIDIPNLDPSLRGHYTADDLALIPEDSVPFTIRMMAIPEPSALVSAVLGGLTLVAFLRRRRSLFVIKPRVPVAQR